METKDYEKAGCNECVHATSKYDWVDGKYILIERKCLLGNTDKLIKWWGDNAHKKSSENNLDLMECHEYHDSTKKLIDLNNLASELLDLLKGDNA